MRILLASSSSGSQGGGEIFLLYLGEALQNLGHQVGLWLSSHPRMDLLAQQFSDFGGDIVRAKYSNTYDLRGRCLSSAFHQKNRAVASRNWQEWAPDIVHINKQNLEDGLDLLAADRNSGIPSICTIHISQSAKYLKASNAWIRDRLSKFCLQRYQGIFTAVADTRTRDLAEFVDDSNDQVRRIYNGTPDAPNSCFTHRQSIRDQLQVTNDQLLITMVARLTAQKSPETFLNLAAKLRSNPKLRFLWVGDGDYAERWDQAVAAQGLSNVTRLGWQDDVRPWLKASDAYLHTAAYEGLPLSILEALSAGLPCFLTASMISEVEAFSKANLTAFDATPGWESMLEDPTEIIRLQGQSRDLYEREFRAEQMARNYLQLYQEAIDHRSSTQSR